MTDELRMRAEHLARARWTGEASAYVAKHGLDMEAVNAHCGTLVTMNCHFIGNGHFVLDDEGTPAIVIEVLGEDDETTIDLCGWPLDQPESFATMLGADALGMANVVNPASWSFGHVLEVYRTPVRWLQARCDGCVVLDHRYVPAWLGQALGPIQAEDLAHARQLHAWLNPRFDMRKILVPKVSERRTACR
jgi:hypothetical protein